MEQGSSKKLSNLTLQCQIMLFWPIKHITDWCYAVSSFSCLWSLHNVIFFNKLLQRSFFSSIAQARVGEFSLFQDKIPKLTTLDRLGQLLKKSIEKFHSSSNQHQGYTGNDNLLFVNSSKAISTFSVSFHSLVIYSGWAKSKRKLKKEAIVVNEGIIMSSLATKHTEEFCEDQTGT